MLVPVCDGVRVGVHVDGAEVVETVLVSPHPHTRPVAVQRLYPWERGRPGGPGGRGGHADHCAGRTGRTCGTRSTHRDLGYWRVVMVAILPVTIIKHGC